MALEQYARIVDAIVKGAEQLQKSLERAATALQRQRADRGGGRRISEWFGGEPLGALDLDRQRPRNARAITRALSRLGQSGLPAGEATAGQAAGGIFQIDTASMVMSTIQGARLLGQAGAGTAGAGAAAGGAGAAAGGAAGAAGAGGAAAGLAAAGPIGIAVAAIIGLTVAVVSVTKALIHMARDLRAASESALEAKRGLAEIHPGMAAVMAMKDLAKRQDDFRRASAMLGTTKIELSQYKRTLESTREWDVMTTNIGSYRRILGNEIKLLLAKPLNAIAGCVNKMLGWEAKFPKTREEALKQHPMLRGLEKIRTGQFYRPRTPPPKPPFNKRP